MNAQKDGPKNNAKEYAVEITTSPDFIQMIGKKLYTNPLLVILVRELLQNSRDATIDGGKIMLEIEMNPPACEGESYRTEIVCDDTGCGMDEDTLVNTFLQIGGSKKAEGSVGGFGVAKVALFATGSWSVHTRNSWINSYNMRYTQRKSRKGTRIESAITFPGEIKQRVTVNLAKLFVKSSNVKNCWLNGEKIKPYRARKILDYYKGAVIGTAPKIEGFSNKIFWRIRGLTQFVSDLGYGDEYGFNVVVDFDSIAYKPKDDNYPFGASRETVTEDYMSYVRDALAPLAKNVLTARKTHGREKVYRERIQHRAKQSEKAYIIVDAPKKIELVDRQILQLWREVLEGMGVRNAKFGMTYENSTVAEHRHQDGEEFFLINPVQIRRYWDHLDAYSAKFSIPLIWSIWHLAVHELTHRLFSDHDEQFTSAENMNAVKTSTILSEHISQIIPQARKVVKGIVELNSDDL